MRAGWGAGRVTKEYMVLPLLTIHQCDVNALNAHASEGWRLHTIIQDPTTDHHLGWPPHAILERDTPAPPDTIAP